VAPGGGAAGPGGGASTASAGVIALLEATTTRWAAATTSAMSAAPYILGSDKAVMAIGGFTGSDPSPTLAQFQEYVRSGQISYFISGGRGGFGGPGGSSSISSWVEQNYTAKTVDGVTVYDLRAATSGS
jgi:4-amino-4-deoxy-L-arabinose transferase-like glycosyltransferase